LVKDNVTKDDPKANKIWQEMLNKIERENRKEMIKRGSKSKNKTTKRKIRKEK
jgi:hypothetical protein